MKRTTKRHDCDRPAPTEEASRREIELRAYFKYCERGCAPGHEIDDWVAAEREVRAAQRGTQNPGIASGSDAEDPSRPREPKRAPG